MTKQIAIYGLFNSRECAYVGQSSNPSKRLIAHTAWFKRRFRCTPRLKIFRWVSKKLAFKAERDCILAFRQRGEAVANIQPEPTKRRRVKVSVNINARLWSIITEEAKRQDRPISYLFRTWLKEEFSDAKS